jgi:hypothetical protein
MSKKKNTRPKNKSSYYHISMFPEFIEEYRNRGLDFELQETTYTKKIKFEGETKMFNSEGKEDWRGMMLMNKVRNDARNYLECLDLCDEKDELLRDTNISFFRLFEKPNIEQEIVKVDLKSAYWKYAIKRGIITEGTDNSFKKLYKNSNNKEAKASRLRALGGLATTKRIIKYVNGKPDYESEELNIEPTKPLYLEICRGVDSLMSECQREVEGVYYYYWDCIFISKRFSQQAIDFFKERAYSVNLDEDKIEFVEHMGNSFIISTMNDKCYMVREEDKNLAAWVNSKNEFFNEDYMTSEFH